MQEFMDNAYYLSIFNPAWDDMLEFFSNVAVLDARAGEQVVVEASLDVALAEMFN